ncbi:hypothetical protein LCGC14_2990420 [marine sediment metagenome]|uniref:HNH nuclease domain-containing protein n=1 Tax=marine sediment metagenome TaxID=412755 RepID=A0A0F8ZV67_9ZZZZ
MDKICTVVGCGGTFLALKLCSKHYQRFKRHGDIYPIRRTPGQGTFTPQGYKQITVDGRLILEHRHIMGVFLGRRLLSTELIHHINEVKDDNRIENLEIVARETHPVIHGKGYYTFRGSTKTHRYCPKCRDILPRSAFAVTKYPGWCKMCHNHYHSHRFVKTCPLCIQAN